VLWAQSIGAGVATTALASLLESGVDAIKLSCIRGLLLETPFIDLQSMLVALYPQKILPYRYFSPFLQSRRSDTVFPVYSLEMTVRPARQRG
jgi:uncharacterized protein